MVIVMAMVSLAQISGSGIGFCGSGISDFAEEWEYRSGAKWFQRLSFVWSCQKVYDLLMSN